MAAEYVADGLCHELYISIDIWNALCGPRRWIGANVIEFSATVTADAFRVLEAERDLKVRKSRWNREFRQLQAADRASAKKRTVIVSKPSHLAGLYKF
jgi:hypothetical protein